VKKRYCSLILLIALFIGNLHTTFAGTYSGGTGTEADPYKIGTAEDLIELSNSTSDWNKVFIQTANVAFNSDHTLQDWNGNGTSGPAAGFSPIGTSFTNFTGVYNGDLHTISNLYINRSSTDNIGLFGRINGINAQVKNLGLIDVNITGKDNTGGLVGVSFDGNIVNSFSKGFVSGVNKVGGLAGYNDGGIISNSFSTELVSGSNKVGGLAGANHFIGTTIQNCYSTSNVSGSGNEVGGFVGSNENGLILYSYSSGSVSAGGNHIGGFVGFDYAGTFTNSFWDTESSGRTTSAGGTGKTTAEMKDITTFTEADWDFDEIWTIILPNDNLIASYPYLRAFDYDEPGAEPAVNPIPGLELELQLYAGGEGSDIEPFLIENKRHLNNVRLNLDMHFKQIANIEFSSADFENGGIFYNEGAGWEPIGNSITNFSGVYNGDGHTISNLYINRSSTDHVGLFGYSGGGSEISNLGVIDVNITGNNIVGGLVGFCFGGNIANSYNTGSVSGEDLVGGLVGYPFHAVVSNSYNTGSVTGFDFVGGLVGVSEDAVVNNCFNAGSVSGTNYVGGLVGFNYFGDINSSYSTGSVSGEDLVGGLVGFNSNGNTSNSFWDTETSGQASSAGGTGKTTAEMKDKSTFTDANWNFTETWNIQEPVNGYISYPYLQGFTYDAVDATEAVNPIPGLQVAYPQIQATNIRFSNVTRESMSLSWTNGDGDKRVVFAKLSRIASTPLEDDAVYEASTVFGNGDKVDRTAYAVYNGTGSSFDLTGLTRNKSYHFRVFEYNEPKPGNTLYLQEENRTNPGSRATLRKETDTENMAVISDFVYPNPAKDVINLELELGAEGIFSAALYDETGRLVKNLGEDYRTASVHSFTWQVGDLSNGFYILMLSHNNEAMTMPVHIAR